MGIHYADQKFGEAVLELATSQKNIHGRLLDAWMNNIVVLTDANLEAAPEVAAHFKQYNDEIDRQPSETGRIITWVNQLSTEDAIEVAHWLVEASYRVSAAAAAATLKGE